mmetsp:Transcript_37025/g.76954  ORF Transcript_37025/g.76954 Transcript_37025/m.76954 type:complete len:97 (+) Transcript_37025:361-651(+)
MLSLLRVILAALLLSSTMAQVTCDEDGGPGCKGICNALSTQKCIGGKRTSCSAPGGYYYDLPGKRGNGCNNLCGKAEDKGCISGDGYGGRRRRRRH